MSYSLGAVTGGNKKRMPTSNNISFGSNSLGATIGNFGPRQAEPRYPSKKRHGKRKAMREPMPSNQYSWMNEITRPRPIGGFAQPMDYPERRLSPGRNMMSRDMRRARRNTMSDDMLGARPRRDDLDPEEIARGAKKAYQGGKKAHGLIRAGVRKLKGNDEGYRLEYSEGPKGGQEFMEHYRSYAHAEANAEKMRRKGWHAVVKPN